MDFFLKLYFVLFLFQSRIKCSEVANPDEVSSLTFSLTQFSINQLKTQLFPTFFQKLLSLDLPNMQKQYWPFSITLSNLKLKPDAIDASNLLINLNEGKINVSFHDLVFELEGMGKITWENGKSYEGVFENDQVLG